MVAVDVPVGGELPVGAVEHGLDRVAVELVEAEHRQGVVHAGEPLGGVEVEVGGEHGEHHPGPLVGRQLDQPAHVELPERVLARHPDDGTLGVVDPRVVRAREPALVPAALGDGRPPVAADVEERAGDPVVAADDEDRAVGDLQAVEVTRLAYVAREGDDERRPAEHLLHLRLPSLRVAVGGDRHLHLVRGLVARTGVDVGQQPASDVGVRCRGHGASPRTSPGCYRSRQSAGDRNLMPCLGQQVCTRNRAGPKNCPDRSGAPAYSRSRARREKRQPSAVRR